MIFLSILLLGFAAFPFALEHARFKMDETARADAPGDFCRLKNGLTHYRYFGPKTGALIVCVHGLTTPSFVFEALAEELAGKGYRVLVYDLYGRGYSDRPIGLQSSQFFVQHLQELLERLEEKDKFCLIGYSMGGAIASAYGANYPERIKKLILLAPAGMGHELGSLAKEVPKLPLVGTWIFMLLYGRIFFQETEKQRNFVTGINCVADRQQMELNYRGFLPSVLASMRGILTVSSQADHHKLATKNVAVVAVWGAEDKTIPISGKESLLKWNMESRQIVIAYAGHGLPYTHTREVLQKLALD